MSSKQRWFCPKISHSFQADRWCGHSSLRCGFQTAFSPFVLFVSQPKRLSAEPQHQQPRPRVVRGQKSRLLLLPWPSIICKLAWGAISQTNAPKQRKKKKYCHLGVLLSSAKTCTCEDQEPTRGWQVFKGRLLIYSRWVPVKTVWTNKRHLYEYIVWAAISELW